MPAQPTHSPNDYRPNVGVVVFNTKGQVWLGRRMGVEGPFNWQFPQGGIDEGEDYEAAALRELYEETGLKTVTPLDHTDDWVYYDFPPEVLKQGRIGKDFKGQKQLWFAYRFTGPDSEVNLMAHGEQEFADWEWCDIDAVLDRVVSFKRNSYAEVITRFRRFADKT